MLWNDNLVFWCALSCVWLLIFAAGVATGVWIG